MSVFIGVFAFVVWNTERFAYRLRRSLWELLRSTLIRFFWFRITDYGLRITDYGLRITDYFLTKPIQCQTLLYSVISIPKRQAPNLKFTTELTAILSAFRKRSALYSVICIPVFPSFFLLKFLRKF